MSMILAVSVLLRIVTSVWLFVVLFRRRDWRILFLVGMLAMMTTRQVLTLISVTNWESGFSFEVMDRLDELPGLIVSLMALLFVLHLDELWVEFSNRRRPAGPSGEVTAFPALIIGLLATVAIVLLSVFAYQHSRDAIRQAVARQNLALGRTVCSAAFGESDGDVDSDHGAAIQRLYNVWTQTESPFDNTYLCVIDKGGLLELHTLKPEMKGTDVGQVAISDQTGQTVMQLLHSRGDWSGENTNYRGLRQLVGYHYEPSIDSLVAVHVPAAIVDAGFRSAAAPWIASMVLIGGLLLPCSLGLIFRTSRRANAFALSNLAELSESEERYRRLVEHAPFSIQEIELDGSVSAMNPAARRIVGVTDDGDLHGTDFLSEVCDEDTGRVKRLIDQSRDGQSIRFDVTTQNGRAFESCFVPLTDEKGNVLRLMGIAQDITERRAAERALADSEQRFRLMFEQAAVGVAQIDSASGVFLKANRRYEEILGVAQDSLPGRTWMELTHPDDIEADLENMAQLRSGAIRSFSLEKRLERSDGSLVWVNLTVSPMWQPGEEPSTHIAIVEDVTDRKSAQRALGLSEERYRSLVNSLAATVWNTDPQGAFSEAQPMWELFTGQPWEEHQHFGWATALHADDRDRMVSEWQNAINQPQPFVTEGRLFHTATGEYRYCEVHATPLFDSEGNVREWFGTTIDVTDRKLSEQALELSEERYRSLVTSSSATVWHTDAQGAFRTPQPMWEKFTGQTWKDHRDWGWTKMIHPDDVERIRSVWHRAVETQENYFAEGRIFHAASDDYRYFEARATPILAGDGSIREWVGATNDIHERRLAQNRIIEQHESTEQMLSTMLDGYILADSNGDLSDVNAAYCEMVGYTRDELLTMNIRQLEATLTPEQIEKRVSEIRQSGRSRFETKHSRKDDRLIDLDVSIAVVQQPDTDNPMIAAFVRDVTDRKRAEQQLRLTQHSVDSSSTSIFWIRRDASFAYVNDAASRHFGYTREQWISMTVHDIDPKFPATVWPDFWANLQQNQTLSFETAMKHSNGTLIPVEIATNLLNFEGDEFLFAFVTEITDRKNAEEAVRQSEEALREANISLERRVVARTHELQQANEDLEAYAHSVAHDLRAPLRAMYGFARALREDFADRLDAEGREYTDFIEAAAQQMDDLIKDLLEYSRIGRSKMSVDPVNLDDVVKRALQQLDAEIHDRKAVVEVEQPLGMTIGHESTLTQALLNLISNGTKFVAHGVTPHVSIRSEKQDRFLRLWVEDNGIGIEPEFQHKIFGVFERLHGVETYPGTGIGLAIVRRAVESMGGQFGVESAPGSGSRFWVELAETYPEE